MRGGWRRLTPAAVTVGVLSACGMLGLDPAPGRPGGPGLDPDIEPIGEVVQIGSGSSLGLEWRYSVYESALGTCTRLDLSNQSGGQSCGIAIGAGGIGPIGLMSVGTGSGSPSVVDGWTADDVAAVEIVLADGRRVPADLMSLAPAGLDGQVFLALVPEGGRMDRAVARDEDGVELGDVRIEGP